MVINLVDYLYPGRLGDLKKYSMLNKKTNHNHKEDLRCIPGLLPKCYHKTSKLVEIIYHPACALLEIIEQWNKYQDTQALSNIDAVRNDKHIHRI